MFTGLVEEIGVIDHLGPDGEGFSMTVRAKTVLDDAKFGHSISVQGVCLSITEFGEESVSFGLAPETLSRTTLGALKAGDGVNLERSVLPTTRLGGHYVQGHVDGTGTIVDIQPNGDALHFAIEASADLLNYIVPKGYVAIDGASLTVIDAGATTFSLMLIAHSQPLVTLSQKGVGGQVNLEVDIMAKYAEKILSTRSSQ